jgi:hypothetical protein
MSDKQNEIVEISAASEAPTKNKSTGPKSAAGKQKSAQNAVIHGLTSKHPNLLANENPQAWLQHLDHFRVSYSPQNLTEQMLIDDLAWSRWLRQRLTAVMAAVINLRLIGKRWQLPPDSHVDPGYGKIAESIIENSGPDGAINTLNRYEARIQREFHRTLSTLLQLRREGSNAASSLHPHTPGLLMGLPASTLSPNPLLPSPASASHDRGLPPLSPTTNVTDIDQDEAGTDTHFVERTPRALPNGSTEMGCLSPNTTAIPALLISSNTEFPNELPPIEEHPHYAELRDAIIDSIRPFPDAFQSFLTTLDALRKRDKAA